MVADAEVSPEGSITPPPPGEFSKEQRPHDSANIIRENDDNVSFTFLVTDAEEFQLKM